jgi:hypothetical protein
MNIRILSLLLSLAPCLAIADGLPLNDDRTKYEGPHILVKMNEDQLEEVTTMSTLTLTREQWQQARAKNPATPKRIDSVLSCMYSDCTCGMEDSTFGVWFKDGTVAIVSYESKTPFVQLDEERKKDIATNISLNMDERGQFYADGKLVPYAEVKARVGYVCAPVNQDGSSNYPSVGIEIPPGSKASDAALAGRLKELQQISKTAGRSFYVFWNMDGLEDPEE